MTELSMRFAVVPSPWWLGVISLLAASACDKTDVGTPCALEPPCTDAGCGFDSRHIYVDRASGKCEEACMVDHLDNGTEGALPANPEVICDAAGQPAGCVTQAALDDAAYCTCRCDGPKGGKDFCECPDGYACSFGFDTHSAREGSYCAKRR
jgi:hypothetical protein